MKDLIVPLFCYGIQWLGYYSFKNDFYGSQKCSLEGKFRPFAKFHESDLPCYKALDAELDLWETYGLNNTSCHPDSISSTLKSINFSSFNNINLVTTCTCVRSFSSVRRSKNYTMVSERLNRIALLLVHQEIIPDTKRVIDLYAGQNRRINFT